MLTTTKDIAHAKAFDFAQSINELPIVIVHTSENESCWMFHYISKQYLETKEIRFRLAGNAPIIIDKVDGSVHSTGSRFDSKFYLDMYERCKKENKPFEDCLTA